MRGRLLGAVLPSAAAAVTVVLIDSYIWHTDLPRPLLGVLDETGHLATALLLLRAVCPLRTYPRPLLLGALSAAVLIDLDHVPSELFHSSILTAGTYRPYGHTLLAALGALAISCLPRRPTTRLAIRGVSLGFALHLTRDLPTGGVPLLWPLTNRTVTYQYTWYVVLLVVAAVLSARTGAHRDADVERSRRHGWQTPQL